VADVHESQGTGDHADFSQRRPRRTGYRADVNQSQKNASDFMGILMERHRENE
jgi:hypothetical protein